MTQNKTSKDNSMTYNELHNMDYYELKSMGFLASVADPTTPLNINFDGEYYLLAIDNIDWAFSHTPRLGIDGSGMWDVDRLEGLVYLVREGEEFKIVMDVKGVEKEIFRNRSLVDMLENKVFKFMDDNAYYDYESDDHGRE